MANINLPFAASATRRVPTADELAAGYGCGDADLQLFDWMAWWLTGQVDGAIEKSGFAVDDADITRLAQAIRSQSLNLIAVGGAASALTAALDPALGAFPIGMPLRAVMPAAAASGGTTLALNGGPAFGVIRPDGTPIYQNDWLSGGIAEFMWNGSTWHLQNPRVVSDVRNAIVGAGFSPIDSQYNSLLRAIRSAKLGLFTASGTANSISLTPSPAFINAADLTSTPVRFYAPATNTGFVTLSVNGISAAIVYPSGRQMAPGDIAAGQIVEVQYNGTVYVLQNSQEYQSLATGNYLVYTTPGTYTIVVPDGVYRMFGTVDGGGGGGGGSFNSGSGGSGGGSGGHSEGWFPTTPGETLTFVVGAGGAFGTGTPTDGSNGAGSSIARPAGTNGGVQMFALGGGGGFAGNGIPQSVSFGAAGTAGISAWAQGFSNGGLGGGFAVPVGSSVMAGAGAAPYQGSITPPSIGTAGPSGHWNGGGGSGGALGNQGGVGGNGRTTVRW